VKLADLERAADAIAERGCRLGRPLSIVLETTSTNDDAKDAARSGAPHGATFVAESQTKGRGRQGRAWVAGRGENLLFSVVLRIPCLPARVPPLSLVVGLAVRDSIARVLSDELVRVKWPNDVLVGEKKIAGILIESAVAGSKVDHLVVGIGINVHARSFPADLAEIATSIALEGGRADRSELLADVLAGIDRDIEHVAHRGLGLVHARLSEHDALQAATVETTDGVRGVACGIDLEGRLRVRRPDGTTSTVNAGEVTVIARKSSSRSDTR
jgi:BirA family transcriptional regulator, biotin operon repressor / biotin---[acetyl-CoA-carboxylase] ligase